MLMGFFYLLLIVVVFVAASIKVARNLEELQSKVVKSNGINELKQTLKVVQTLFCLCNFAICLYLILYGFVVKATKNVFTNWMLELCLKVII